MRSTLKASSEGKQNQQTLCCGDWPPGVNVKKQGKGEWNLQPL